MAEKAEKHGYKVIHETSHNLPAGLVDRVGDFIDPDIILIHDGTITTIAAHYNLPYVNFVGAQLPKSKGSNKCKDYLPLEYALFD